MKWESDTVAVRTGGPARPASRCSLWSATAQAFRAPAEEDGLVVLRHCDAAFRRVPVRAGNLIGEENAGFRIIMRNFNAERLGMSAGAVGFAQACVDEALAWAHQRKTFGKRLVEHQVVAISWSRCRRACMRPARSSTTRLEAQTGAARHALDRAARDDQEPRRARHGLLLRRSGADSGRRWLHPRHSLGTDLPRGKGVQIGGDAEEIMKDLAARQLGW